MTITTIRSTSYFIGLTLSEPVTFLTDLMISVACFLFCILMHKSAVNRNSRHYWQWFFGTLGVSTFLGGLGHLLLVHTGTYLLLIS
jgi:hypothetical protein